MDFSKILNFHYWFTTRPNAISESFLNFLIVVLTTALALYILTKILVKLQEKKKNFVMSRYFAKWANLWLTALIVLVFLLFFRYEQIPFLSGRFWLLFAGIGLLAWIAYLVFYFLKRVPEQKKTKIDNSDYEKYLPKSKKKKKKNK